MPGCGCSKKNTHAVTEPVLLAEVEKPQLPESPREDAKDEEIQPAETGSGLYGWTPSKLRELDEMPRAPFCSPEKQKGETEPPLLETTMLEQEPARADMLLSVVAFAIQVAKRVKQAVSDSSSCYAGCLPIQSKCSSAPLQAQSFKENPEQGSPFTSTTATPLTPTTAERERFDWEQASPAWEARSCTSRKPWIGEAVKSNGGVRVGNDEDGTSVDAWILERGELASVFAVNNDGNFKLKNPAGVVSDWLTRNHFLYIEDSGMDGNWTKGRISGELLIWSGGDRATFAEKTSTCLTMISEGEAYTAELREDGMLHWSDGDIWERQEYSMEQKLEAAMDVEEEPAADQNVGTKVVMKDAKEDMAILYQSGIRRGRRAWFGGA